MSKNLLAKYHQNLSKEEKKSDNMVEKIMKVSQRMKIKSFSRIEKNIMN